MVPKPAPRLARRASLGASGAIYAAFALCACTMPHVQLSLVFLPMLTFPIKWGFGSLVLLDVVGAVRGWRVFDHVAHLGGAAFGFVYYWWVPRYGMHAEASMVLGERTNRREFMK